MQVEDGTATVDLSGTGPRPSRWPLQALVHTLTQFPTVRRVQVRADGRAVGGPLARDRDLPLAPIALAEPAPGAVVTGERLVVKGEASVYEGTVSLRLRDDHGQVMAQGHATAAEGAPGRGQFAGALRFTPPAAPPPLDPGGLRGQRRGRRDRLLGLAAGVGGSLAASNAADWTSPGRSGMMRG